MPNLYSVHDEEGAQLVPAGGWCVALVKLLDRPGGKNYSAVRSDIRWIVRLNWGYGDEGTIPLPQDDAAYLQALEKFVRETQGAYTYIIGNEPNHENERPQGQVIAPERYASFYNKAAEVIKRTVPGARCAVAAPAPYHAQPQTWTSYFAKVLQNVQASLVDDLTIHTYARGSQPEYIWDVAQASNQLAGTFWGFLSYRDALACVPETLKSRQALITEFDELIPWVDQNTGIVKAAYSEINWWNQQPGTQKIGCLTMYRYPKYDEWYFEGKQGVIQDFKEAVSFNFQTPESGHTTFLPQVEGGQNPSTPPPPPPLDVEFDPRAWDRGVRIEGDGKWKVKVVQWYNEQEADRVGPDRHILVDTLDENGNRLTDVPVVFSWGNGFNKVRSEAKPGEIASANQPMTPGTWSVTIEDPEGSQKVTGIQMGEDTPSGFNPGIHTSTRVVFQKVKQAVTQPKPPSNKPSLAHPVQNPAYRFITQPYGRGVNRQYYQRFKVDGVPLEGHNGIDYATPVGSRIVAADSGAVVETGNDPTGYGLYAKLKHSWGESLYAHMSELFVSQGQTVDKNQSVGLSGNTGASTGPHLHFGTRLNGYDRRDGMGGYSDPLPLLSEQKPQSNLSVVEAIKSAAEKTGLDWRLLASQAWAESSFRPEIEGGLFQIEPETWDDFADSVDAVDKNNPVDNALVGATYLKWLVNYFDGNKDKAILAYNFGIGNVLAGNQPPSLTKEYVNKVNHGYDLLRALGV